MVLYKKVSRVLLFMGLSVALFAVAKYLHGIVEPWANMPFKSQMYDINVFIVLGMILFIVFFYRSEVLNYQKLLIESNKNITDSINYAQRIQKAILPEMKQVKGAFEDAFVLFRPRDVVSGDFYWFHETKTHIVIAVVDCTGHGVPGAFMSMIGNELLNHIVLEGQIIQPSEVLTRMHEGIRNALRQQTGTNAQDGMDLALCTIDKEKNKLYFSGAKNPLIYIQDGQVHHIKGDKWPIGGHQRGLERNYRDHEIDLSLGQIFYVFSDGYQDQFGGGDGRKFMIKRLKQLLLDIHRLPLPDQCKALESTLDEWMTGTNEAQVDDILMIGFKPKSYDETTLEYLHRAYGFKA
jgi:serine phosphatase RsbU (regulator of sigma subunit)